MFTSSSSTGARFSRRHWAEHWLVEVEALVQAGDLPKAAKLYRHYAAVTWDEAHNATRNWTTNAPERKAQALYQALTKRRHS
jgi:hypothetical protein